MTLVGRCVRWTGLCVLLLVLAAALLAIGEFVTRWWYQDITTTGDNGSWFAHRWHVKDLGTDQSGLNSHRFRDAEWVRPKLAGEYRIAIVGDSFTYGQGIDRGDRFGERLEQAMNGQNRLRVKVLNLGKPGASSRQNAFHLRSLDGYEPDFVLIQFTANDVDDAAIAPAIPRASVSNLVSRRDWHHKLHRNSALYFVANAGYARLQALTDDQMTYAEWLTRNFADPATPQGSTARDHLRHLVRTARRHAEAGLVIFPMVDGPLRADNYAYGSIHVLVDEVCTEMQLDCLDLRQSFAAAPDAGSWVVNRFDGHPNAAANAVAARAIMEHFAQRWESLARP